MNSLLLSNTNDKFIAAIVSQGQLLDYAEHTNSIVGNIYKARVEHQLTEISAIFADVGSKQQVFVNCNDIPPTVQSTIGSSLLLQITRPSNKKKAATATGKIKISGKFLIYMPLAEVSGISKKISDSVERQRLIAFLHMYPNEKFVVRTAATAASYEQLHEDAVLLINRWQQICKRFNVEHKPRLLFREFDFVLRYVRDNLVRNSITEIITDDKTVETQICEFLNQAGSDCLLKITEPGESIFSLCKVSEQIAQLSCRELILTNGVRIVIDTCEALTAIDVNSGNYASGNNPGMAVVEINTSAAQEIMRQIRLRNLSGIIVIDFLKMDVNGQEAVKNVLADAAVKDVSKIEMFGFTRAGLFEIVRKSLSFDILVDRDNSGG
ncbi:MAG: ribonuclease E/G [Negativicutes bacterium]|jgi:ribonuclease G